MESSSKLKSNLLIVFLLEIQDNSVLTWKEESLQKLKFLMKLSPLTSRKV